MQFVSIPPAGKGLHGIQITPHTLCSVLLDSVLMLLA